MDKFEKQFEDLDVRSAYMEGAMDSTTSMSTPEDQVSSLMNQVADEHGLTIQAQLGDASTLAQPQAQATGNAAVAGSNESDLAARLANLHS